jgi:uncharacterized cupin superfamily protein
MSEVRSETRDAGVLTHLVHAPGTALEGAWEPVPIDSVTEGAPLMRTTPLGAFQSGGFGFWEMTEGIVWGQGATEVFVVVAGEGELRISGLDPMAARPGTLCQYGPDATVEMVATSPLTKFYFGADVADGACDDNALVDTTADLPAVGTLSAEESGGTAVDIWLRELASLGGAKFGVWQIGRGRKQSVANDEVFIVLSGSATLRFAGAESFPISAGSVVRTSRGDVYEWDVHEPVRKFYLSPKA